MGWGRPPPRTGSSCSSRWDSKHWPGTAPCLIFLFRETKTHPARPPPHELRSEHGGPVQSGGAAGTGEHPCSSTQPSAVGASSAFNRQVRTPVSFGSGRLKHASCFCWAFVLLCWVCFAFFAPSSLVDRPLSKRPGRGGGWRKGYHRPPPDSKAGVESCTKA